MGALDTINKWQQYIDIDLFFHFAEVHPVDTFRGPKIGVKAKAIQSKAKDFQDPVK